MSSEARLAANRANAALSTGPVTDAGKLASSHNSFQHGLTAKQLVLPTEDAAAFDQLRTSLLDEYAPQSTDETILFDTYVASCWRYRRALSMETSFIGARTKAIQEQQPDLTADEAAAMIFIDPEESKRMRLFMRYFSSIERAYNKAYKDLLSAIAARPKEEEEEASTAAEMMKWIASPLPPLPVGFVSHNPIHPSTSA